MIELRCDKGGSRAPLAPRELLLWRSWGYYYVKDFGKKDLVYGYACVLPTKTVMIFVEGMGRVGRN